MLGDNNKNPLEISDEDFLNISPPETSSESSESSVVVGEVKSEAISSGSEPEVSIDAGTPAAVDPAIAGSNEDDGDKSSKTDEEILTEAEQKLKEPKKAEAEATDAETKKTSEADAKKSNEEVTKKTDDEPKTPPNYEEFYKQVMEKPIKANGREIKINTPEEAVRLIQMGAGLGKKLQDLQPALKTVRMLEKNNLLDTNKVSRLIDIQAGNKEAIKALLKENNIDPLDLNMEDNANYSPGNHTVTDNEMSFVDKVGEFKTHPEGLKTLSIINTYDDKSKEFIWANPGVMDLFHQQRELGIYDQITAEIDRQKTLGYIPNNTPFVEAYKIAGDALVASKAIGAPANQQPSPTVAPSNPQPASGSTQQQPQVIETRPAALKPQVANSDKVKAASPTPTTPRKAATTQNPLDMADDDFLKTFKF